MTAPRIHEGLRKDVLADLAPVRPVVNPERRALVLLAWVPLMVFLILTGMGLRKDASALGPAMLWGPLVLQTALGLALVATALVLSIPGRAGGRRWPFSLLVAGILVFLSQTFLTYSLSAGPLGSRPLSFGSGCLAVETVVGLTSLALMLILARTLAPSRVLWPCVLAAAGAGLMAEGVYRLHCGISDPRHVLLWHGGSVLVLILVAFAAGKAWEAAQRRRMVERIARRRS